MIFPQNVIIFLRTPADYLQKLQNIHGDPFPLVLPKTPTLWLTGKSEFAKVIFTAPVDSFKTSEKNPVAPLLGKNGLIMVSGNEHLSQRRELSTFFSKNNLRSFSKNIISIFFGMYQTYERNGVLNLQKFAMDSTLKIILNFIFPHLNTLELKKAESLTKKFLNSYSPAFLMIPTWIPGTWNSFNLHKNILDDTFYDYFLSGKELGNSGPLSCLVNNDKETVLDHIRTLIVAGHETSATSLSWALFYIHKDLLIKERLLEEINTFNEVGNICFVEKVLSNEYIDCIVKESFRIRPPVPFVNRKTTNRAFHLDQRLFNIDEELGVCITLLHQQNEIWNNPNEFRPERFIERNYSVFEYSPFGGGTRKCIGADLAIMEIKLLIVLYFKFFDSQLQSVVTPSSEVMQITIGPKKNINCFYTKKDFIA